MKGIMIVEDEVVPANYLMELLQMHNHTVVGIAKDFESGIRLFHETNPELILCDIRIESKRTGIDLARELRTKGPFKLIYLTAFGDEAMLRAAQETKPDQYLLKPYSDEQLLASVKLTLLDGVLDAERFNLHQQINELTERELDIVRELVNGSDSHQIAAKLFISKNTVDTHRRNILLKLDFSSTMELVIHLLKHNVAL
jgi:DNA-binding NarL/FixJ family response regulator